MLPEHIRLQTKQVVATALAQRMITPVQAELVMAQAAEVERRGVAHLNVAELMVQLNLINTSQAAQLVQIGASAAAPQTFIIGKYLLTNRLGAGAMGTVYLAVDQTLQRKVALKILSPQLAALPEFVGRFKKEARTTAQLSHRNIVHVYDVDETDGFLYYVMEYLEGAGLDDVIKKRGKLSPAEAVPYVVQAARGLEAAHKAGIIHRDVKPANLFVTKDGTVKLVDLGLSKDTTDQKASEHSMAGMAIGTPHYIAPEQARGLDGIDGRADIYGLGCTLYTLLTGTTPYQGPNPLAIMSKQINDPPPNPRALVPGLPAAYTVLIELMMAKNPNDRYQTCTELVADLERVVTGKAPMGASVAVANEGAQDVPMLKRRAVTSSTRGSSSVGVVTAPKTGSGGPKIRTATALALEASTGEGSSGFRRVGPPTRRTTSRFDRIEPRSEGYSTGEQVLPFYQRYQMQLWLGGAALAVILIVVMVVFSNSALPPHVEPTHVATHTDDPRPGPGGVTPTVPPNVGPHPVSPTATAPGPVTPAPLTPEHSPTTGGLPLTKPDDMSPYEWSKLHPPPPVENPPPANPAPGVPAGMTGDGTHPASYTAVAAGFKAMIYLAGTRDEKFGHWGRMDERTRDGIRSLHWRGDMATGATDMQYPFFDFDAHVPMSGSYQIRGRVRRNSRGTLPLRLTAFSEATKGSIVKLSSYELNDVPSDGEWHSFMLSVPLPTGSVVSQLELRTAGVGTSGESIDVEWMEIDEQVGGAPAAVADRQVAAVGALLHVDCNAEEEAGTTWHRCMIQQEGKTTFAHWVFMGNVHAGGQVTAPLLSMDKGFSWAKQVPLTVKIRLRGRGTPRFNVGLKIFYHNAKGASLNYQTRVDFVAGQFGEWQVFTLPLALGEDCTFDEMELRPFDTEVQDGSIDVDWVEFSPKGAE